MTPHISLCIAYVFERTKLRLGSVSTSFSFIYLHFGNFFTVILFVEIDENHTLQFSLLEPRGRVFMKFYILAKISGCET